MEATIFTGWVYDFLKPHAVELKVAHPEMLKAITAAKKKNDRADAERICDLLRVDLLPECYMLSAEIRELRRVLRYRNMVVRNASQMKNKIAGLLMEVGESYDKRRLHGRKYFHDLLDRVEDVPESVKELLLLTAAALRCSAPCRRNCSGPCRRTSLSGNGFVACGPSAAWVRCLR